MISQKKFNTKQFNEVILMEENMIEIKNPRTFCFNYDLPKDVDQNRKGEVKSIIKRQL